MGIHLGIDASNIRQGGGLTHLSRLLEAGDPLSAGIDRISIWANYNTLSELPNPPWLNKINEPWLESNLASRLIGQQFRLPFSLRANGCDVLFSPGGTIPVLSFIKCVTISQNMLPFEPCRAKLFGRWSWMRAKMFLLRASQSKSFLRADGLIFLTDYARTAIKSKLRKFKSPTVLIPHGIEPRFLQKPCKKRCFSNCSLKSPFRFLYVSIMMPYKHQIEVARAIHVIRSQGYPVEIQFVGDTFTNYGRSFKKEILKLDPDHEFIHVLGSKPFNELHSLYQKADAFIFASSCENLPNILIEAMASGLPIASSNRGPMPEILGGSGIFFDPERVSSIVGAVKTILGNDGLRLELAYSASKKARKFSWNRCACETFRFIAQIVKNKRS